MIAVIGVALAVGTTCATAASLPIAAGAVSSAQVSAPGEPDRAASPSPEATIPAAPPSASSTAAASSRLHIRGQKWVAPQLQRSEAGIAWSLTPKVTLELNYERSAMAPTMPHDHDDGFLTRLKLGF